MIWAFLKPPLAFLAKYPWQAATLAAVLVACWFYSGWASTRHKFEEFKAATIVAAKQAEVRQAAVNHEPARKSAALAEKSNAEAPLYYQRVADASRVQNPPRRTCPTPVPGTTPPVEGVHGPDPDTTLVPTTEYNQLVYATARGLEMQAEAEQLIVLGVAVGE